MSELQQQAQQYAQQQKWPFSLGEAPPPPPSQNPPMPPGPALLKNQEWPGYNQWGGTYNPNNPGWQGYNWNQVPPEWQQYYGQTTPIPPPQEPAVVAPQPPPYDETKDPEIAEFDKQFKEWEQKFEAWKEENKNHPDKAALANYEETWTKWRDDLLEKREVIKKKKQQTGKEATSATANVPQQNQNWVPPKGSWPLGATAPPKVPVGPLAHYGPLPSGPSGSMAPYPGVPDPVGLFSAPPPGPPSSLPPYSSPPVKSTPPFSAPSMHSSDNVQAPHQPNLDRSHPFSGRSQILNASGPPGLTGHPRGTFPTRGRGQPPRGRGYSSESMGEHRNTYGDPQETPSSTYGVPRGRGSQQFPFRGRGGRNYGNPYTQEKFPSGQPSLSSQPGDERGNWNSKGNQRQYSQSELHEPTFRDRDPEFMKSKEDGWSEPSDSNYPAYGPSIGPEKRMPTSLLDSESYPDRYSGNYPPERPPFSGYDHKDSDRSGGFDQKLTPSQTERPAPPPSDLKSKFPFEKDSKPYVPFSNLSMSLRDTSAGKEFDKNISRFSYSSNQPDSFSQTSTSYNRFNALKSGTSESKLESNPRDPPPTLGQENNKSMLNASPTLMEDVKDLFEKSSSDGIPGLDIPSTSDTKQPEESPKLKSPVETIKDDKKDIAKNLDETPCSRLNIGPIGVTMKSQWKPPEDWYEDEEDCENKSDIPNKRPLENPDIDDVSTKRPNLDKLTGFSDGPMSSNNYMGHGQQGFPYSDSPNRTSIQEQRPFPGAPQGEQKRWPQGRFDDGFRQEQAENRGRNIERDRDSWVQPRGRGMGFPEDPYKPNRESWVEQGNRRADRDDWNGPPHFGKDQMALNDYKSGGRDRVPLARQGDGRENWNDPSGSMRDIVSEVRGRGNSNLSPLFGRGRGHWDRSSDQTSHEEIDRRAPELNRDTRKDDWIGSPGRVEGRIDRNEQGLERDRDQWSRFPGRGRNDLRGPPGNRMENLSGAPVRSINESSGSLERETTMDRWHEPLGVPGSERTREDWNGRFDQGRGKWDPPGRGRGRGNWNEPSGRGRSRDNWNEPSGRGRGGDNWNEPSTRERGGDSWNEPSDRGRGGGNWSDTLGRGRGRDNWNQSSDRGRGRDNGAEPLGRGRGRDNWADPTGRGRGRDNWADPLGRGRGRDNWADPLGRGRGRDNWADTLGRGRGGDNWTDPSGRDLGVDSWNEPSGRGRGREDWDNSIGKRKEGGDWEQKFDRGNWDISTDQSRGRGDWHARGRGRGEWGRSTRGNDSVHDREYGRGRNNWDGPIPSEGPGRDKDDWRQSPYPGGSFSGPGRGTPNAPLGRSEGTNGRGSYLEVGGSAGSTNHRENERSAPNFNNVGPSTHGNTTISGHVNGNPQHSAGLISSEHSVINLENSPDGSMEEYAETVTIDDLIGVPGRFMRPPKLVIILRGLPGSGKSTIAKMIKEKEIENGGSAPRILCLDDYFMVETEKMITDVESGRKSKAKAMEYEYEPELEESYRNALTKSFKKQVDEKFFPFIIIDCINSRVGHFTEMWEYAKRNDFEPFIAEIQAEVSVCSQRNIHHRKIKDIEEMYQKWEPTPNEFTKIDLTSYIQDAAIEDVVMEDSSPAPAEVELKEESPEEEDDDDDGSFSIVSKLIKSKWDTMESQEAKLDKLDGVKTAKIRISQSKPQNIEDWLQLSEEFKSRKDQPGKKRVKWADIEERKRQENARDRGFVLGQTDWQRMTDTSFGSSALVQVRYIERIPK